MTSKFEYIPTLPNHIIAKAIYDKGKRPYHNWNHIEQMVNLNPADGSEVGMFGIFDAIVWHDSVYKMGDPNNEYNSFLLYKNICSPNEEYSKRVETLIMATKDHVVSIDPDDPYLKHTIAAQQIIIDLDLYNLGGEWKDYVHYGSLIRKEFLKYNEKEFMEGRKAFLEKYLARDKIYLTPFFSLREFSARNNMERELYIIENFERLINYEI